MIEVKPKFEERNEEQRERVGQLPTPLMTKRELTEENNLWEDRKIFSRDPSSSWGKKPERINKLETTDTGRLFLKLIGTSNPKD